MPVVTLKMGSSLNPDDIKEGADVYFECLILSNPKPYKMSWFHNVSIYSDFSDAENETFKKNLYLKKLISSFYALQLVKRALF